MSEQHGALPLSPALWDAFSDWRPPLQPPSDWASSLQLLAAGEHYASSLTRAVVDEVARWDELLDATGGEISRVDWTRFRPLRLSREEDWSDWFAFLLERSCGTFVERLLFGPIGSMPEFHAPPSQVDREQPTLSGSRRADLIVLWEPNLALFLEVKIGDTNFDKTFETVEGVMSLPRYAGRTWIAAMLLPVDSVNRWHEARSRDRGPVDVRTITWTDVCVAFRSALAGPGETPFWRAYAAALCGAAEQRILGHPVIRAIDAALVSDDLAGWQSAVAVMRSGRKLRER